MKLSLKQIILTAIVAMLVTIVSLRFQSGERLFTVSDAKTYDGSTCAFSEHGFPLPAIYSIDEPCSYSAHLEKTPTQFEFLDSRFNIFTFFTDTLFIFILLLAPVRYLVKKRARN